jgi:MFS family permease
MVFNFGVMFGAILFGFLSDKFGRKKSFIFALVAQAFIGCATAASPNFYVFTVLRFLVGALEQVRYTCNNCWTIKTVVAPFSV